jgi:hypothetical protein
LLTALATSKRCKDRIICSQGNRNLVYTDSFDVTQGFGRRTNQKPCPQALRADSSTEGLGSLRSEFRDPGLSHAE